MIRYPTPHINYMPLKSLTDELYNGLLGIYLRAKTYTCTFEVVDFTGTEMSWPETDEEHEWICNNILPYYGIEVDEILSLEYTAADKLKENLGVRTDDSDRTTWGFNNVPDRTPNSLNFTRIKSTSHIGTHSDHEAGCKINIPILNMGAANIYFRESGERYFYPTPVLLNCPRLHEVENMHRMEKFNIPERTFFQIIFKKPFEYYKNILPLPLGY